MLLLNGIWRYLWRLCVGLLLVLVWQPAAVLAVPQPVLTWSAAPTATQTVSWQDDVPGGEVQYIEGSFWAFLPDSAVSVPVTDAVDRGCDAAFIHTVVLHDLRPDTSYIYRAGRKGDWSAISTFRTAPAGNKPVKFLVFGDSQSIDYRTWQTTLHNAWQANGDAAFFINAGDLVDCGQDCLQWQGWFAAAAGVIDKIPVMPIVGNHETYTVNHRFSLPSLFTRQLALPQNGPDGLKGQAYSFDCGPVHFVMLDTQEGEEHNFQQGNILARQAAWMAADLAACKLPWKIAVMHRPPYTNRPHGDNPAVRKAFVPVFDRYQVDVAFTAHDHVYARTYPLRAGSPTAGGTVYIATGRSGTKCYHDLGPKAYDAVCFDPLHTPVYLVVKATEQELTVRAFTQQGQCIDTWTAAKQSGDKGKQGETRND